MKQASSKAWLAPFPALVIIILIGTSLRLFRLDYASLWLDEATSLAIARNLTLSQILENFARSSHPPLYYLLLHFWVRVVGINDYLARFPSAISSLLSIPLIYQVGRHLFNYKIGLWAALMLAVQPFQIRYAQEVRMYALLLLLTLVTLLAFVRAIQTGKLLWWGFYWAALVLALYTHYFIGFVVLVFHFFILIEAMFNKDLAVYWRRYRRIWLAILITDVAAVIAFLPQIRIFLTELGVATASDYWLNSPSLIYVFTTMYFLIFGDYQRNLWFIYTSLFVILGFIAIGSYEILVRKTDATSRRWQILLLLGAYAPIAIVFIISQFKPIYLNRTLIICTPFLTLLLAVALQRTSFRSLLPYLAITTGSCIIITFYGVYINPTAVKSPMREAARYIWQNKKSNDLVIHLDQWTGLPSTFYSSPAENYLLLGNPYPLKPIDVWEALGGRTIAMDAIGAEQRVWLVTAPDQIRDWQREQLRQIGVDRSVLVENNIGGISVCLYGEAN